VDKLLALPSQQKTPQMRDLFVALLGLPDTLRYRDKLLAQTSQNRNAG